ncbi:hypothetical protein ACLQ2U_22470 [Micromonospora sp. DT47]
MGVVVAAGSGALVEVGRSGVGVVRVAGEVDDGAVQLFVDGPPDRDDLDFAGLAGGGRGVGQAGQGLWGGEASSGIADLGEQAGGTYGSGAGQRGEDRRVGMSGELFGDLVVEGADLLGDGFQGGDQGEGYASPRGGVGTGCAGRGRGQVRVQLSGTRWSQDTTAGRSLIGARWRKAL